jgi:ABC-type uncharacterized transport system substrate-binding protein
MIRPSSRREFISLLGGAAVGSPLAARAQPGERVRRIGVILSGAENDREMQSRIGALREGLRALGWIEGRNFRFEYRWPGGVPQRVRASTAELVRISDIIVVGSLVAAQSLRRDTSTLPIVFVNLADPVGAGLIASLARTGGNITGFTAFEYATAGKWLELLKEISPRTERVAFVFGGSDMGPTGENFYRAVVPVASTLSIELTPIRVKAADNLAAIDEFAANSEAGLVSAADQGFVLNRRGIIAAAARHRMPAVYPFHFFVTDGGLACYGTNLNDQYRRAASYVDRILRGTNPADLPVQAPVKFEFIINLKTAKALGLEIAPSLLTRADEVIV